MPTGLELETRLKDANAEIEKRDYEKTILDVNALAIDENYEKKALSLYTAFLKKFPQSPYAKQINEAIGGIRNLLGTTYFEDLKKVAPTDFMDRHAAYSEYLEQFPEGSERKAVERMITDLAQEYHGVYLDYLEKRPDTTQKETIAERINALNTNLARQKTWKKRRRSPPTRPTTLSAGSNGWTCTWRTMRWGRMPSLPST